MTALRVCQLGWGLHKQFFLYLHQISAKWMSVLMYRPNPNLGIVEAFHKFSSLAPRGSFLIASQRRAARSCRAWSQPCHPEPHQWPEELRHSWWCLGKGTTSPFWPASPPGVGCWRKPAPSCHPEALPPGWNGLFPSPSPLSTPSVSPRWRNRCGTNSAPSCSWPGTSYTVGSLTGGSWRHILPCSESCWHCPGNLRRQTPGTASSRSCMPTELPRTCRDLGRRAAGRCPYPRAGTTRDTPRKSRIGCGYPRSPRG